MGKKRHQADALKKIERTVGILKRIGKTYPHDLEEHPGADDLIEAHMTAAGRFVEPIANGVTAKGLREGVHASLLFLDQLLDQMPATIAFADIGTASVACHRGCHHCCHIRVTTKGPVVLALAFYLRKKLSSEQIAQLVSRLRGHVSDGLAMTPLEQVLKGRVCPLNVDGVCIGYEYRPYACRTHHSFDVSRCQAARQGDEADVRVPQDPNRHALQALVSRPVNECTRLLGLNTDELEFIPALLIALTDEGAAEKYIAGEPVFAPAHRPDVLEAQQGEIRRLGLIPIPQSTKPIQPGA